MPLKCKACGQCHTARRGCADVYATLERMAGPMPEPKGTPGEWVLECGKHHQPYRACCEGRYTLKWEWKDADPTPPPVETDAGRDDVLINEARVSLHRRLYGTTMGAELAEEHVSSLLARLAAAEAENGRLRAENARLQEARTADPASERNYLAAQLGAVRRMLEGLTDRDFVARMGLESRRDELERELAALETPTHD
jgi:hypothetical protein